MFRVTGARLLTRASVQRSFSSSPSTLVKIRSSNPRPSGSTSSSPSPAERPPAPPSDIPSTPPPFEPEVSKPSAAPLTDGPAFEAASEPSNTPLEQPSPADVENAIPDKPDLTKLPSLDIDPDVALPEPEPEGGAKGEKKRTGAKEREYVSSMERTRRAYLRFLLGLTLFGGVAGVVYMGQGEAGSAEQQASWWERVKGNTNEMVDYFNKPAFKTLLPDPLPPTHQRPYTLLVDLDGMLVSSTWNRATGWQTVKRPGVDYFLGYMSQFYEIVLFSSQPTYTAVPVAEKLDPFGAFIPYKLFRDSTRFHEGKVVKDLSYLNRDLQKVILLETNAEHGALQPENTVVMRHWDGKPGDKGLVEMIPFLESIAMYNVKDVRPIVKAYQGKDIPIEYAKKEAEAKRVVLEEWERKNGGASTGGGSSWLGSMFGGVAGQPGQARPNQPMTYLDQKRAEAQKTYLLEQKYWKDHEEEFKKMVEEDKARQMAEMKGSLMGFFGGGGGAQPKKE